MINNITYNLHGLQDWYFNVFLENKKTTFDAFQIAKNNNKTIAIDIGGWIGVTSIWLCKNFKHVVIIEPDPVSFKYLEENLFDSDCNNFSLCNKPIFDTSKIVIFGPESKWNLSNSFIKNKTDNDNDIEIKTITFGDIHNLYIRQFNNDYFNIFINIDINGCEEKIIVEILHYAILFNSSVYITFYIDKWVNKNIYRYDELFKKFKTNIPNVSDYLDKNHNCSILFI